MPDLSRFYSYSWICPISTCERGSLHTVSAVHEVVIQDEYIGICCCNFVAVPIAGQLLFYFHTTRFPAVEEAAHFHVVALAVQGDPVCPVLTLVGVTPVGTVPQRAVEQACQGPALRPIVTVVLL